MGSKDLTASEKIIMLANKFADPVFQAKLNRILLIDDLARESQGE